MGCQWWSFKSSHHCFVLASSSDSMIDDVLFRLVICRPLLDQRPRTGQTSGLHKMIPQCKVSSNCVLFRKT